MVKKEAGDLRATIVELQKANEMLKRNVDMKRILVIYVHSPLDQHSCTRNASLSGELQTWHKSMSSSTYVKQKNKKKIKLQLNNIKL
jgi:hypothetical protein